MGETVGKVFIEYYVEIVNENAEEKEIHGLYQGNKLNYRDERDQYDPPDLITYLEPERQLPYANNRKQAEYQVQGVYREQMGCPEIHEWDQQPGEERSPVAIDCVAEITLQILLGNAQIQGGVTR